MSIDSQKIVSVVKKWPGIAIALLASVLVLGVVYFRYDQVGIHETQLSDLQANLAKLQRNVANSAQLDRQLTALKQVNGSILSDCLVPAELARNSQYFYTLEANNHVKLLELQQQAIPGVAKGAATPLYVPLNFSVNLTGDYEQLLKFMREVEKTFIGGKVLSAVISPASAAAGRDPAKARLLSMVVQTVAANK